MSPALIAVFVWLTVANVIAMLPSRRKHWPAAYGLIAVGLPLVFWLGISVGWFAGVLSVLAAGSVLRWPVVHSARWIWARFH